MSANSFRTSPTHPGINSGYPTPNDPIQGIGSDLLTRSPNLPRVLVGIGRVVDIFPLKGSCLIETPFDLIFSCSYSTGTAAGVTGIMSAFAPSVGDNVVFVYHSETNNGMIVGGVMPLSFSLPGSEPIVPTWGEYKGTFYEMLDPKTFKCDKLAFGNSGSMLWSDLISGENESMSEAHVGTAHGKLYYRIQAGNLAAINFNQIDSLIDVIAHNFKFFNSGFKIDSFCDYGRTTTEILTSPSLPSFITNQKDFHTIKLFSGWFASGVAIQSNKRAGQLNSETWNDELGISSTRTTVSAWISKQNGIFIPKKIYEADDLSGKGDKEIKEEAKRIGFKIDPESQHPAAFGCMARDYVAWQTSGGYRFERFKAYKNDWEKEDPQKGFAPTLFSGNEKDSSKEPSGQYAYFFDAQKTGSPQPNISKGVDSDGDGTLDDIDGDHTYHRQGDAFMGVLPDGSVLLRDAWGSSIEMRGGKIVITNAKDTEIISGHNTVIISGNDVHIKAQNSADIHTTNKNVRIRSGRHTMIDSKQGSIQLTAMKSYGPKLKPEPGDPEPIGDKYNPTGICFRTNGQVTSIAPSISNVTDGIFSVLSPNDDDKFPLIFFKSSATIDWSGGFMNYPNKDQEGNPIKGWDRAKSLLLTSGNVMAGSFGVYEQSVIVYEAVLGGRYLLCGGAPPRDPYDESIFFNGIIGSIENGPFVRELDPRYPIRLPKEEPKRREGVDKFGKAVINQEMVNFSRFLYLANDTGNNEPWKIYKNVFWHYRRVEEYGTSKEFVWFENFWQRQFKDSLVKWSRGDSDIDEDKETVYPGKKYILESEPCYIKYEEANVYEDGTPKKSEEQNEKGGKFDKEEYLAMTFHPSLEEETQ
jgi:hypothetical protein